MMPEPGIVTGQPDVAEAALTEALDATLTRWQEESSLLERDGAYAWLCSRVAGRRVLEIGCGFGASTAALVGAGKTVFALDNRLDCLQATQQRAPDVTYGVADVHHYDARLLDDLTLFAPDAVVCWLAGTPAESLPRDVPAAYAVMQYRLQLQQSVLRLAARLDGVQTVHLADRTAFPWKMKDAGRQTMMRLIETVVAAGTPFSLSAADVQFRKLAMPLNAPRASGALQGVTPVLGEATLKRRQHAV